MPQSNSVNCRYAIITGSASGLGRELAVQLAAQGWHLALVDLDESANRQTLQLVESAGGAGQLIHMDVADVAQWRQMVDRLQADWPRLDLLINNAGVACSGEVDAMPLENWQWLLGVNLHGVIYGCHTCLPWLKANSGRAHLINIASVAAVLTGPAMAAYNVAKAGVLALSETLLCELHGTHVKLTVACPGFFASNLLDRGRFLTAFERSTADRYTATSRMNSQQIAARILRDAFRGKSHVVVPLRARCLWHVRRLLPSVWLRLVGVGYRRALLNDSSQTAVAELAKVQTRADNIAQI
jgi:NAD(P)-dependent dehydrogenase (short-subunit alcohol dehydrogenase family)